MTIPTHVAVGLFVGMVTGHPLVGVLASILIDLDHFVIYARHGVLKSPKLFWKIVSNNEDPYGGQRWWLHSLLVAIPLSVVVWFAIPIWAPVLILSYLGHILLDILDSADYWPLFPFKKWNIRGPIRFFSLQEFFICGLFIMSTLFIVFVRL